jgi:hypothetical protein
VPFKTFTANDVLTAADVNDYLMEQAVISCTSGTRPSSPVEGMTIRETDTDRLLSYDGSGWVTGLELAAFNTFATVWASSGTQPALGNGTLDCRWVRMGRCVVAHFGLVTGSTTTYGTGTYSLSLPVARNTTTRQGGGGHLFDTSGAAYNAAAPRCTAQTFNIVSATAGLVTPSVPWTWATGDEMHFVVIYEASS